MRGREGEGEGVAASVEGEVQLVAGSGAGCGGWQVGCCRGGPGSSHTLGDFNRAGAALLD